MQTFVVKLASGLSALVASIVLAVFNIKKNETGTLTQLASGQRVGLRGCMTLLPIVVLIIGYIVYKKNYKLTDEKLEEITQELEAKKQA